ncbi:MAG: recombination regulator RecX [Syntrophus sp. PtaB.Bin001]|nr:MAG: recombination regulator RecX [Syntrophus sp. PtaB.Bin001]
MIGKASSARDSEEKARQKAWRLLSIRPHSERELWKKLRDRGFSSEVLVGVFKELKECRYLDDKVYACQQARYLAIDRLLGNSRIEYFLREKGLDTALITEAIKQARQEFSETEALRRLIERKLKSTKLIDLDDRNAQKIIRSLWGKGFSTGLIFEIFRSIKEEECRNDQGRK